MARPLVPTPCRCATCRCASRPGGVARGMQRGQREGVCRCAFLRFDSANARRKAMCCCTYATCSANARGFFPWTSCGACLQELGSDGLFGAQSFFFGTLKQFLQAAGKAVVRGGRGQPASEPVAPWVPCALYGVTRGWLFAAGCCCGCCCCCCCCSCTPGSPLHAGSTVGVTGYEQ